jgi:uncharacterized protein
MPHGDDHVERVKRLAEFIALKEGADLEIVRVAAELHDVARQSGESDGLEKSARNHALEGAEIAERILIENHNKEFIEKVKHCIASHSFSSGVLPETLEAKILSDADKLDAMGAVGVARAFMFAGETGRSIEDSLKHFEDKLLRLKDLLNTDTAREISERRHQILEIFYKRLKDELSEF